MSDLIVIGYPDENRAQQAWDEIVKLQNDYHVDLEGASIIRRDEKGKLHLTTRTHHALAGAAGGIMGAALGAAGDLGIKEDFKQRVQDLVQPGTSAILVILRKVTPDKFEEALRPYGGTVLRTSLSHEQEQELMKALHGDDPSAPTWEQSSAPAGSQA